MHRTKLCIPRPDQDPPYEYVELDTEQVINTLIFTTIYDDESPEGRPHYFGHERAKFLRQIADFIDANAQPHANESGGASLPEDGPKQSGPYWSKYSPCESGLYVFMNECRNPILLNLGWGVRIMCQDPNVLHDQVGRPITNLVGLWYGPIAEPPDPTTNT